VPDVTETIDNGSGNDKAGDSVTEESTGYQNSEIISGGSNHTNSSGSRGVGGSPERVRILRLKKSPSPLLQLRKK
jgi:hypothetical protein